MNVRYIAYDCETGGITTDRSLLTAYFLVLDGDFNPLDSLDLKIKPNKKDPYVVTAEALSINRIDLVEHDKVAITESEAGGKLREFLECWSDAGAIKLTPIGQNIAFDEEFINAHILSKETYKKYISYRKLDTATIAMYLQAKGDIPRSVTGSLSSLMDYFGIEFSGNAHEAEADTLATVEVLKRMLDI